MANDPTLAARQAIVTHLRADTSVTGTAVGTRIYGERTPATLTWPFARYGVSILGQLGGRIPIHVFSKSKFTDEAAAIMAAIVTSLGGKVLDLGDGRSMHLHYPDQGGSQIIGDAAEADAWHGIISLEAIIARECAAA